MVLADHLLDMAVLYPQHHKQVVIILNHVLAGAAGLGMLTLGVGGVLECLHMNG